MIQDSWRFCGWRRKKWIRPENCLNENETVGGNIYPSLIIVFFTNLFFESETTCSRIKEVDITARKQYIKLVENRCKI